MAEDKKRTSSALEAEINKQRHEQNKRGIGEFDENVGGGTPATGGGRGAMHTDGTSDPASRDFVLADSPEDPKAIEAKKAGKAVRYLQPRDEETGQFAPNSANKRDIHYKSRAKHKPIFLRGVTLTFLKRGSTFIDEDGTRTILSRDISEAELVKMCSRYFEKEGGFLGFVRLTADRAPQGRRSAQEKEVKASETPYGYSGEQKYIGERTAERMEETAQEYGEWEDGEDFEGTVLDYMKDLPSMNYPKGVMRRGIGIYTETRYPKPTTKRAPWGRKKNPSETPSPNPNPNPNPNPAPQSQPAPKPSRAEQENKLVGIIQGMEEFKGIPESLIRQALASGDLKLEDFEEELKG